MAFFDRRTASILLTILAFALALAIIYLARTTIVIFAFSILFAYLTRLSGFFNVIPCSLRI